MAATMRRLMFRKETVRMKMQKHSFIDGQFKHLQNERQVQNKPVAAEHRRIKGRLFEDWRHLGDAEILQELALQL